MRRRACMTTVVLPQAWLLEINEYASDDVVIMLLGNKCDISGDRVIRKEDGERLARVRRPLPPRFLATTAFVPSSRALPEAQGGMLIGGAGAIHNFFDILRYRNGDRHSILDTCAASPVCIS